MTEDRGQRVAQRFRRLLDLYRRPDGSEWGGQDLETATGGAVTRSYVSSLRRGRIDNPGLEKMEALAGAMGFPPALWFGDGEAFAENLHSTTLEDPTAGAILEQVAKLGTRERDLLLSVARVIASPGYDRQPGLVLAYLLPQVETAASPRDIAPPPQARTL